MAATLTWPAYALAGDGTFRAGTSTFATAVGPVDLASGDFDGDGDLDLAVANSGNGAGTSFTFATNDGGGNFSVAGVNLEAGMGPNAIALADVTGDGDLDVITANGASANFSIAPGLVGSGFAAAQTEIAIFDSPTGVAVGDFNADSAEDLLLTGSPMSGSNAVAAQNNGMGTFTTPVQYIAGASPAEAGASDFNGDGDEDLVVALGESDKIAIRGGAPGFAFDVNFALVAGPGPQMVTVADFDLDGEEDLAIPALGGDELVILHGDTQVGFVAGGSIETTAPHSVAVGDFNSDGRADLVSVGGDGKARVRLGRGDATFRTGQVLATGSEPRAVVSGDFNGDGILDLASADSGADRVTLRFGKGKRVLSGNLLRNGGFEGAGAARRFNQAPAIPRWKRTGGMTFAVYGYTTGIYSPTVQQAPLYEGGVNHLYGGAGASSTASQTVQIPRGKRAAVKEKRVTASFSAYLGGGSIFEDRMRAIAKFLGSRNRVLGALTLGPVTAEQRDSLTTMLRRKGSKKVPRKTRKISVTLAADANTDAYNGAVAENVKLTLKTKRARRK